LKDTLSLVFGSSTKERGNGKDRVLWGVKKSRNCTATSVLQNYFDFALGGVRKRRSAKPKNGGEKTERESRKVTN